MNATISFNDLPEAVTELTRKVDELYRVINNVSPHESAEQFLTVEEAAEFLNLTKPTIYSKVSKRELPYMKRGKRLYFARQDLSTYLHGGRVKTVKELEVEQILKTKERRA